MKETETGVEGFYARCAELLGTTHQYTDGNGPDVRTGMVRTTRKTRWNGRHPGNGRFPGSGIIRVYGSRVMMSLYHPVAVTKWFEGTDDALAYLAGCQARTD